MRPDISGAIDLLGIEYVENVDIAELKSEEQYPKHMLVYWSTTICRGDEMANLPVHPDDLEIERERGRMCLVLLPNSQAVRWSLNAESDADSDYEEQRQKS